MKSPRSAKRPSIKSHRRRSLFESLEPRMLLNADWQNPARPLDVNNSGQATPLDSLILMNRLNRQGAHELSTRVNQLDNYYDVNGDGLLSPLDPLIVLNRLNRVDGEPIYSTLKAEGASEAAPAGFISLYFGHLPGGSNELVSLTSTMSIPDQAFREIGFFAMDDATGKVGGVEPTSPGYADVVFAGSNRQVMYSVMGTEIDSASIQFAGGSYVGVYVLQGTSSSSGTTQSHMRVKTVDNYTIHVGWERNAPSSQWPVVGDRGYDDVTIQVEVGEPIREACAFDDGLTGWTVFESGGNNNGRGTVAAADCAARITEGDSFVVGLERNFTVPATPTAIQFSFEIPSFDTADPSFINDAFEVALVDLDGNALVAPFTVGRDAFYNVTEGMSRAVATGVLVEGNTITVGLNGIPVGTKARLIFRLANNDSDVSTTARITDMQFISSAMLAVSPNGTQQTRSTEIETGPNPASNSAQPTGLADQFAPVDVRVEPLPNTWGDSVLEQDGQFIYDTSGEFLEGILFNLNATEVVDHLSINRGSELQSLPLIWISNSGESTVSKFDTRTGKELGRYRTGAGGDDPSRIAVTRDGDAWVANRGGNSGVVKVLHDTFVDRNGNGVVDTSADQNGDGIISAIEILPWDANGDGLPDDERIAFFKEIGGGPRGVAIDANNKVWVSPFSGSGFRVFDNDSGELETIVEAPAGSYGAVVDRAGNLWSAGGHAGNFIMRFDVNSRTYVETIAVPSAYGITVDQQGIIWTSPWPSAVLSRYDPILREVSSYNIPATSGGGITVDREGNLWFGTANSDRVWKFTFAEDRKTLISSESVIVGSAPKSASIDADGYLWTVSLNEDTAYKVDTQTNTIVTGWPIATGSSPYNYSDMTGDLLFTVTQREGTWTDIIDAGRLNAPWAGVEIDAQLPPNTSLALRVRTANDRDALSSQAWATVEPNQPLPGLIGRFIEVQARLSSRDAAQEPIVDRISVQAAQPPQITVFEPAEFDSRPLGKFLISGQAIPHRPEIGDSNFLNDILYVAINNLPVDTLDTQGNFFANVDILAGVNRYEITAFDRYGQSSTKIVYVQGMGLSNDSIDFSSYSDITGSFSGQYFRTSFKEGTKRLHVDLATRNDGQFVSDVPLLVGVKNISDPSVRLVGADGFMPDGTPYYDYSNYVEGGSLQPGQLTDSPTVLFHNPNRIQFDYELVFLGKLNEAPYFTSVPRIEAIAGRTYTYDADAIDPDEDSLTYSLMVAPAGMNINRDTGAISWTTTNDNIGQHEITVHTADGRGGTAKQRYTVHVIGAPPNRPPVISSTPSTMARVGQSNGAGRIVVAQDINTLSPSLAGDNEARFASNVAEWLIGGNSGNVLLIESNRNDNRTYIAPNVKIALEASGFAVTATLDVDLTEEELSQYDAVFLGQSFLPGVTDRFVSNSALINYVEQGGGVYLHGGVGIVGEANGWSEFLRRYGLEFSPTYNGIYFPTPITTSHPIFRDVPQLATGNGQPIIDRDPNDSLGRVILGPNSGGYYAVYDSVGLEESNDEYRYDVNAIDLDDDPLKYDFAIVPTSGMMINQLTGDIVWNPTADQVGNHSVKVRVDDGRGGIAEQEFVVCVHGDPTNHPPTIVSLPNTSGTVATAYSYKIEAVDPDKDSLTYKLESGPEGMTVDPQTGLVSWNATGFSNNLVVNGDFEQGNIGFQTQLRNDISPSSAGYYAIGTNPFDVYGQFNSQVGSYSDHTTGTGKMLVVNGSTVPNLVNWEQTVAVQPGKTYEFAAWASTTYDVAVAKLRFKINGVSIGDILELPSEEGVWKRFFARWDSGTATSAKIQITNEESAAFGNDFAIDDIFFAKVIESDSLPIVVSVFDGRGGIDQQPFTIDLAVGTGEIRGAKFNDSNNDGVRNAGESSLESWTIYLDQNQNGLRDAGERTVLTDSEGKYAFTDLPEATYYVREEQQPGWRQTFPGLSKAPKFYGPTAYLGRSDSPFLATDFTQFWLEDFEDGELNIPGVTFDFARDFGVSSGLSIFTDIAATDSVDEDDGLVDGRGSNGGMLSPNGNPVGGASQGVEFFFDAEELGTLPTHVGIVWTDGSPNETVIFEAIGPVGNVLISSRNEGIGDNSFFGTTDEDRFFGASNPNGIRSIRIYGEQMNRNSFEVDHLQIGIGGFNDYYRVNLAADQVVNNVDFLNQQIGVASNDPPRFLAPPDSSATIHQLYRANANAVDPDSDPLTFSLSSAPNGMTVHLSLGTVVWIPSEDQVGVHNVVLSVSDGRGGTDLQAFSVNVTLPNIAPEITSLPASSATAGATFQYHLRSQDADGDTVTYTLENAPAGMTIEHEQLLNAQGQVYSDNYSVNWVVPESAAETIVTTTLVADDGNGGTARQTINLNVLPVGAANSAPEFRAVTPLTARIGTTWTYMADATDPNSDPITFSLQSGPNGMTVTPEGLVTWNVLATATGNVSAILEASDGRGGIASQHLSLQVVSVEQNQSPVVISVPSIRAVTEQSYRYDPVGTDADGDSLIWSLSSAPRGMSIDPQTGSIRWTPDDQQLGAHSIAVTATDPYLATYTQRFDIAVACNNIAPSIVSVPPTVALTQRTYLYAARGEDLENDSLTWSLSTAPTSMSIDAQTGVIRWNPLTSQIGTHDVVIEVSDGLNVGRQMYSIVVSRADDPVDPNDPDGPTRGNRAPIITSSPVFNGQATSVYQYQAIAIDPDGDNFTWSLSGNVPTGMTISLAGLVTWTPVEADAGEHLLSVVATDAHGSIGAQGYLLNITVNTAPEITSSPVTTATSGALYRYTVRATDADGDSLSYRLTEAPAGMTIDRLGRILWQSAVSDTSVQSVSVTVDDGHGGTDTQSWQITMQGDTQAPVVSVSIVAGDQRFFGNARLDVGTQYTVQLDATDNVQVTSIALFKDGVSAGLNNPIFPRSVTFGGDVPGVFHFLATATDAAGLTGEMTLTVTVGDPATSNEPVPTNPTLPTHPGFDPTDNQRPNVIITSPDPASTVSNLTSIIGTVDDPEDNLWYYRVYYARADRVSISSIDLNDSDWQILHESTQEVIDGELAVFDPSTVSNDPYAIVVAAFDVNGRGYVQPTVLYVEGNVQVGNFRLEFTDLSIPLAGIPISVSRVYDTVSADDEGDFGYGWSLGVQDARILEVAAVGPGGALNGGNDKFIPDKTKVYLTNPSGQRIGFTYKERLHSASFFGGIWTPYFEPDLGVYDTLTIDQTQVARGGLVGTLSQGINPDFYTLTTKEGLKYRYGETAGLQTITDLNGNVATFTENGISHTSGQSIQFVRDHRGRITEIVDPASFSIHYTYNLAGDLTSFTNQTGLETRYEYLATPAHYLDQAFDSLDKRVLKAVYELDENGKNFEFKGIIDVDGNRIDSREFDTDNNTGIVRDANGNATTLVYDDRGNVLTETDPLGKVTTREYNDSRNPDLETRTIDREGNITDREYDARGNLMTITERGSDTNPLADLVVTAFTYDSGNRVSSITNAANATTAFVYDSRGNLTRITNAEGISSSFTYDSEGRRSSFTDFNGNTTTFDYTNACPCGSPSKVTFADGTYQEFVYNHFGHVTREAFHEADGTLVELRETRYDNSGRVFEEKSGLPGDPDHPQSIVRKVYDGHLLDWEIIVNPESPNETPDTPVRERLSRITDFDYDNSDRLIRQTDAEGGIVEFRYDAQGNRIALMDPVGNITTWLYDSLNRVIEERDPLYWDVVQATDAAFAALSNVDFLNLIAPVTPDSLPNPLYDDPSGANAESNTGADHVRVTAYDAEGNQSKTIDRNGRRREFKYDHAGRLLTETWYAAVTGDLVETINFTYDTLGNMLTAVDSNSNYLFTYDTLNRLESVDNNPDGTREVPRVILTYAYDAQGNVISTSDDAGVTVGSTYNARNQLATRTWFDTDGSGDVDDVRVDFFYSAAGRESEIRRYSDLDANMLVGRTLRTYDAAGRSNRLTHVNAVDELLAGYDYDYDFAGLLLHETRSHQDSQYAQTIDYAYDLTGQLTFADFDTQDDETYVYDANGNRITSQVGTDQRTYATGSANQLESDGTYRYEYDGEGNQVKRIHLTTGETRTLIYDHRNRLVRVNDWSSDPGDPKNPDAGAILTQTVEYMYDSLGRRVAREVYPDGAGPQSSEKEFFIYNGDNVWADFNEAGEAVARYLFGNRVDQNVAKRNSEQSFWYLSDRLGTVRDVSGKSGAYEAHTAFETFGGKIGASDDRYGFTGREFDNAIQTFYFRARQYDSHSGRFLSRDEVGISVGEVSLYRFAFNSAGNGTDPTGNISLINYALATLAGFGIAAAYVGYDAAADIVPAAQRAGHAARSRYNLTCIQEDAVRHAIAGFMVGQRFGGGVRGFLFVAGGSILRGDVPSDVGPLNGADYFNTLLGFSLYQSNPTGDATETVVRSLGLLRRDGTLSSSQDGNGGYHLC